MRKIVVVNFQKYHQPASRELTSSARGNGKLKWVRLETDWHHDAPIRSLPAEERQIWPILIAEAGKGEPHGTVAMTNSDLADAARVSLKAVQHALAHLRRRGKVTIVTENAAGPSR